MWNGGANGATTMASPQLEGFFWGTGSANEVTVDSSGRRKQGISGRFAFQYPFAYISNDWIMDVRSGSWFRLDDPASDTNPYKHMFYDTNANGKVYACRGAYDATHLNVVDLYDPAQRTSVYQWVSQPIIASMLNEMVVEEIILTAQGVGLITVTLQGIDGDEQVEFFDISSPDRPYRIAKNTNLQASELTVVVRSEGGASDTSTTNPAPVIHSVNLGHIEAVGIARDNNA